MNIKNELKMATIIDKTDGVINNIVNFAEEKNIRKELSDILLKLLNKPYNETYILYPDIEPMSMYFVREIDGYIKGDGGIIYHANKKNWQIHT